MNSEDVSFRVGILAKCERIIKNLVFPHVQVKNDDQHNDAIVEPPAGDVNMPVFFLTEARQTEVEGCSIYSGELDIHVPLEVREFPVLEKNNNYK